jgi:hypothetical protein
MNLEFPVYLTPKWGKRERNYAILATLLALILCASVILGVYAVNAIFHPSTDVSGWDDDFTGPAVVLYGAAFVSTVVCLWTVIYIKRVVCWRGRWVQRELADVAATRYPLSSLRNRELLLDLGDEAAETGAAVTLLESASPIGSVWFTSPRAVWCGDTAWKQLAGAAGLDTSKAFDAVMVLPGTAATVARRGAPGKGLAHLRTELAVPADK